MRAAIILPAWVVGFSLMGVGALANDLGFSFWMATLSTALVWAGPAQLVMFGGLAAGASLLSVALAVTLSSMRLLPMAISLLALIPRRDGGVWWRLGLAHYAVTITWAEGMRKLPGLRPRDRTPWLLGFANVCVGVSTILTALGFVLSDSLPVQFAAGFMFLTPLFFSISLVAWAKGRADIAAIVGGVALIPIMGPLVGPDLDLLVAGVGGGLMSYAIHRSRR